MDSDPLTQISDECKVCRQEAIYYLEGLNGDLDVAMDACRNKKVLPRKVKYPPPRVSANEEYDKFPPYIPPMMANNSVGVSIGWRDPPAEPPPQSAAELIHTFCSVILGTDPEVARSFLVRCNWDANAAVNLFYEERSRSRSRKSQPAVTEGIDWASMEGLLRDPAVDAMANRRPMIGPSSSSSQNQNYSVPVETEKSLKEAPPLTASSQVNIIQNIQASRHPAQVGEDSHSPLMKNWVDTICGENNVSREEAIYYLEGFNWDFGVAMENCRRKTVAPVKGTSSPEVSVREESAEALPKILEQLSQLHTELISVFRQMAPQTTREEAIAYLKLCNWDIGQAISFFLAGMSIDELSLSKNMSLMDSRGPPLPQLQYLAAPGSQTQSHLKEGEIGSSSSSINADPPETERSLKTAGEENITLAVPGTSSSQVEGKAVEEDSSMETLPVPFDIQDRIIVGPRAARTAITIDIILADGETVKIPFRLNQTVRDIRNAIDELRPDGDRGYYLQSHTAVECRDLDMKVKNIFPGDWSEFNTLFQLFSDP